MTDFDRIRELEAAATPGPWKWDDDGNELLSETAVTHSVDEDGDFSWPTVVVEGVWHNDSTAGIDASSADAAFIAEARRDPYGFDAEAWFPAWGADRAIDRDFGVNADDVPLPAQLLWQPESGA